VLKNLKVTFSKSKFTNFYLASVDKFVSAVPVRENGASGVEDESHVDAVLASSLIIRLSLFPHQLISDPQPQSAPSPLPLATLSRASRPEIQVVRPSSCTKGLLLKPREFKTKRLNSWLSFVDKVVHLASQERSASSPASSTSPSSRPRTTADTLLGLRDRFKRLIHSLACFQKDTFVRTDPSKRRTRLGLKFIRSLTDQ